MTAELHESQLKYTHSSEENHPQPLRLVETEDQNEQRIGIGLQEERQELVMEKETIAVILQARVQGVPSEPEARHVPSLIPRKALMLIRLRLLENKKLFHVSKRSIVNSVKSMMQSEVSQLVDKSPNLRYNSP